MSDTPAPRNNRKLMIAIAVVVAAALIGIIIWKLIVGPA